MNIIEAIAKHEAGEGDFFPIRAGINSSGCRCISESIECRFRYVRFGNSRKKFKRDRGNCHDRDEISLEGWKKIGITKEEMKNECCHDCGVKYGQIHHVGCDMERCPSCSHQLLSCSCADQRDYT